MCRLYLFFVKKDDIVGGNEKCISLYSICHFLSKMNILCMKTKNKNPPKELCFYCFFVFYFVSLFLSFFVFLTDTIADMCFGRQTLKSRFDQSFLEKCL